MDQPAVFLSHRDAHWEWAVYDAGGDVVASGHELSRDLAEEAADAALYSGPQNAI